MCRSRRVNRFVYGLGGTDSVQAWEYVARGSVVLLWDTREGDLEARRLPEAALNIDADYINATVLLGYTHFNDAFWNWGETTNQSLEQALRCGKRALELDDKHPDSRILLALCASVRGQHDEAILLAEEGVALAPSHARNTFMLEWILRNAVSKSCGADEKSDALKSNFPSVLFGNARHLLPPDGDNDLAIQNFKEAIKREPDGPTYKPYLTSALIEAGQDESRRAAEDVLRVEPEFSASRWTETFRFFPDQTVVERAFG